MQILQLLHDFETQTVKVRATSLWPDGILAQLVQGSVIGICISHSIEQCNQWNSMSTCILCCCGCPIFFWLCFCACVKVVQMLPVLKVWDFLQTTAHVPECALTLKGDLKGGFNSKALKVWRRPKGFQRLWWSFEGLEKGLEDFRSFGFRSATTTTTM